MNKEEVLRVIVESIPAISASWIDILSALLTPTIALIALYIAYQQHKTNQQRLRHETYERRLKVYKAVQAHLSIILRAGKTSYQECTLFYSEASEAAFLFDKSVMDKIVEYQRIQNGRTTQLEITSGSNAVRTGNLAEHIKDLEVKSNLKDALIGAGSLIAATIAAVIGGTK